MQLMVVVLNEYWEFIHDRLENKMNFLKEYGVVVNSGCYKQGKTIQIEYTVKESSVDYVAINDFRSSFKYYMADVISDIIIYDMEEIIAYKILSNNYYYFGLQERKAIIRHFKNVQKNEVDQCRDSAGCMTNRKEKIYQQIVKYLKEKDIIHLEGFIRFRLKTYIDEIKISLDRAVEDFLMEKEYNEFIRLLRYFVDIQEAKIDIVNVLMTQDGKYHLYDDKNIMINNEYLEDLASEMSDKDISYDDLLISALITLAPKRIVMHFCANVKKREIIETIQKVFSDRVCTCSGCELCLIAQKIKQE